MIKVASYCRVSTDKEDQSNSFEAQQRYFRDYIRSKPDWDLYQVYADEGITGTSTQKRTQFIRMIADAREGKFQQIITKEVSRFSRNILDTIQYTRELKELGIGVLFVLDGINTMNPDAELYLSIMGSIAQEESRKTSSRVVWGQTRQMERGVVFGSSMLGYDVTEGRIKVDPAGAEIVRLIFHKYAEEQTSTSEIARFLEKEGYLTYKGSNIWNPATIIKILKNEKYVGDLIQKKTYTPNYLTHEKKRNTGEVPLIRIENHHEPIVSRDLWNLAQDRLRKNRRKGADGTGHSTQHIFSGKVLCGECGSCFVGRIRYDAHGAKNRRWRCAKAAETGCRVGKLVRDDDALQMLKTALQSLRLDGEAIVDETAALIEGSAAENSVIQYSKEIHLLQKKREAMLDSYYSGEISNHDMNSLKLNYDTQLTSLLTKKQEAEDKAKKHKDHCQHIRTELRKLLHFHTDSEVFLKSMLERLTVYKDRHMELKLRNLPFIFWFSE